MQIVETARAHALRALVVASLAATTLMAVPAVAEAELTELPDQTWGVVGLFDSLTTNTASEVMAIEQVGNTIYVGGQFTHVVFKRNGPQYDQPFLAAFDATSGEWIDWWRPDLNGPVFALDASPDGKRLYVGGEFTTVNGIGDTQGLVALDPATGEVDPDFVVQVEGAPSFNGPGVVRTVRATSDWVYVGGSFNYLTGPDIDSRTRIYRVGRVGLEGTPDATWRPFVTGGSVWGLDVDDFRGRVYLAGFFETVDNEPDTGNFIAVRTSDGTPITHFERFPVLTPEQPHQFEVIADNSSVWVVGTQHLVQKLDATDLSLDRRWFTGYEPGFQGGGDFQALGILGDRMYASCHCWGTIRELPPDVTTLEEAIEEPVDGEINGLIAFDRQSGDWLPGFKPDLYGPLGGFALHGAGDGCLWAGGDLNRRAVGDLFSNGVVRFCDEAGQGPPVAPPLEEPPDIRENNPPTRPLKPAVTAAGESNILFEWNESTDDSEIATYIVYRDGVEIGRTRRTAVLIVPGGTLSVRAVDVFGNQSAFSNPVESTAIIPAVLGHWPLDGGAQDFSGNDNHGNLNGALNTPGRVIDAQQLAAGDSIVVPANSDLRIGQADTDFTISGWIYVANGPTGSNRVNLDAEGVATLGTAATSNRVRITVTTNSGNNALLSSSQLQVRRWTHVALVRKGSKAKLYVNGELETTRTLSGSTTAGNGRFTMTGDVARLDEVMIHGGALTGAQVSDLAAPGIPDGLWLYYPLEGNAKDRSGNGYDATVTGTTTVDGVYGQAIEFNGSNVDGIELENDPSLHPGENDSDFTVSFWMNLQQDFTGAWRTVTHKGTNSADRTFAIWMRPFDNRLHFRISSDEAWNLGNDSVHEMVVGEWTHLTYSKRGDRISLFVNGDLDNSASIPGDVVSNDGAIYIGDSPWFQGTAMIMDDFRIYAWGLREDDASALAGTTQPPDDPPPPEPPSLEIIRPRPGAKVDGDTRLSIESTSPIDGIGTLDVEVRIGDDPWTTARWNRRTKRYTYLWNASLEPLGEVLIRVRSTDSNGLRTTKRITVEVAPPAVAYGAAVKSDRAFAFWRLNDDGPGARDSIDGTHKAFYRGPTTQTAPLMNERGFSATFDGEDDVLRIRDHVDINSGSAYNHRTVELWFEAERGTRRQVLYEEGGAGSGISVYLHKGRLYAGAWDRGAWESDVFISAPFEVGKAYHVVVVMNGNTGKLRLFMNGNMVKQKSGVATLSSHAGDTAVGARAGATRFADRRIKGGVGNFFDGRIDEVALYNRPLTAADVAEHYAAASD